MNISKVNSPEPDPLLIKWVEDLLEDAKKGDLRSIVCVGTLTGGKTFYIRVGTPISTMQEYGELNWATHEYERTMIESNRVKWEE